MPQSDEKTILIVEDDAIDYELVEDILIEVGQQLPAAPPLKLRHAGRLSDCLTELQTGAMDLILLDLSLPDSRGLETFNAISEVAGTTPIIVFTGLDDEHVAASAIAHGAQSYLVKGKATSNLLVQSIFRALRLSF